MAYNKYDSDKQVSFMDGIPVKISEQYKPPKKISLPGAVLNKLNVEIALPEYDFTLEKSVLEKMSQWRRLRQSQRDARQERMEVEKQARAVNKPDEPERTVSPTSPTSHPTPTTMLMPIPIHASTHSQSTNYSSSFNISEFEQDTSSPFDNMELKTINDLEELAHVLQPVVISEKAEIIGEDDKKNSTNRLNGFNIPYSYNSLNWTSYNQFNNAVHPSWGVKEHPTHSYVVQRLDSRSVPDILQQLESELRDKREADQRRLDQPQRPASTGPVQITRKVVPSLESLPSLEKLPNPYAQMSPTCQQLCDRLAEMGFPHSRVARATELFGDDQTRVVEFLIQVQRLEEMKFPGERAERALIATEFKDTETLKYLNTQSQLLDLGFSEDQVDRALKECGYDRDKALDWLVS